MMINTDGFDLLNKPTKEQKKVYKENKKKEWKEYKRNKKKNYGWLKVLLVSVTVINLMDICFFDNEKETPKKEKAETTKQVVFVGDIEPYHEIEGVDDKAELIKAQKEQHEFEIKAKIEVEQKAKIEAETKMKEAIDKNVNEVSYNFEEFINKYGTMLENVTGKKVEWVLKVEIETYNTLYLYDEETTLPIIVNNYFCNEKLNSGDIVKVKGQIAKTKNYEDVHLTRCQVIKQ